MNGFEISLKSCCDGCLVPLSLGDPGNRLEGKNILITLPMKREEYSTKEQLEKLIVILRSRTNFWRESIQIP